MGKGDEKLDGFSFRSGVDRCTIGIVMWSDVFLHENELGEKLAIILIDTQGLFDNSSGTNDNSQIFTLNTLISSLQFFNIKERINSLHLQHLQVKLIV
jgi:atlastin